MTFTCWGGAPLSGLSRNQLQLLNNTPNTRKKQRIYADERPIFANFEALQLSYLQIVPPKSRETIFSIPQVLNLFP
jgi:hypothetical protein